MAGYEFEHLVVVAAHSAFRTSYQPHEISAQPFAMSNQWVLEPYQSTTELPMMGEHLRAGLEVAASRPASLLVLSAGFTRPESVGGSYDWSDAHSYFVAGRESGWYDQTAYKRLTIETPGTVEFDIALHSLLLRGNLAGTYSSETTVALSDYARDSLEEQLGGLATFVALAGGVPRTVTEIGWEFKEARLAAHAKVLGLPESIFTYIGVGNPPNIEAAKAAEKRTAELFQVDELGLTGLLAAKRIARDPLNRGNPHWNLLDAIRKHYAA